MAENHTTACKTFWDIIDAVLVINMPNRQDRWDLFVDMVSDYIPSHKLHRIEAVVGVDLPGYKEKPLFTDKTPKKVARMKAGSAGCCLSHRKAVEFAKSNGWGKILILEDDAHFLSDMKGEVSREAAMVLTRDDGWDMFYLGFYQRLQKYYTHAATEENGRKYEIARIRGPVLLHAVILHERIYDEYLAGLPDEKSVWDWLAYWGSIDSWIYNRFGRQKHIRIWGIYPSIVIQRVGYSDIVGKVLLEEEAQGTHRARTLVKYDDLEDFEKTLNPGIFEKLYQKYKRTMRVIKARCFGYKKT